MYTLHTALSLVFHFIKLIPCLKFRLFIMPNAEFSNVTIASACSVEIVIQKGEVKVGSPSCNSLSIKSESCRALIR